MIDLLLMASDEDAAFAQLKSIGWMGRDEDGQDILQPPFQCAAMKITPWRKVAQFDDQGALISEGEKEPGFWMGLCIADQALLDELWGLPGIVAALERESGKILRLKGLTFSQMNGLETIQPVWAGSNYHWGELEQAA